MPYKIVQEGNKFKVVAQNTGHIAGTHPSKEKAQAQMAALYANEPEASKMIKSDGGYKPTSGMKSAARKAIKFKEEGKAKGAGTNVGWTRAHQIVSGESLSLDTVKRMFSFFSRHEVDKKGKNWGNQSDPSNGYIMWLAWGGDSGFSWSRTIVNREKKIDKSWDGTFTPIEKQEAAKCMLCGCEDLGNDHHYISDTEKCLYCFVKGQGPCWEGYEYAGTKEKDGKTVPNCIPSKVKKMEFSGGNNAAHPFTIDFNTPDCLGGYSVIKAGTAQSIGCYLTREEAEKQLEALVVGDRSNGNDTDSPVKKSDTVEEARADKDQKGIGQLAFWNGSFAPVFGSMFGDARYNSTFNTPPSRDGKPTAGYGNQTGYGYSNQ